MVRQSLKNVHQMPWRFFFINNILNIMHKSQKYGIANKRKKYNNILRQKMSSLLWSVADWLADCWHLKWLASYITGLLSDWLKDYLPNWLTGERTAIYLWGLSLQEIRTLLWNLIPPWLTAWLIAHLTDDLIYWLPYWLNDWLTAWQNTFLTE